MDKKIRPLQIIGPLFYSSYYKDVKDPCIVFDGTQWHIYGSGGDVRSEHWQILHAISDTIEGPWKELPPVILNGAKGDHVAAPSVWFEEEEAIRFI